VRILVANDDGVSARGITALSGAVSGLGADVTIAGPSSDWSGAGTAVGRLNARGEIPIGETTVAGRSAFVFDGPPCLGVVLDRLGAFGPSADLVLAGVNAGSNCGAWQVNSGTVGIALTAAAYGCAAAAISLTSAQDGFPESHWQTSILVSTACAEALLAAPAPGLALNVNVPALPIDKVRGWRWTSVARGGTGRPLLSRTSNGARIAYSTWDEPLAVECDAVGVACDDACRVARRRPGTVAGVQRCAG
jgi:5'-nucleotidase